MGRGRKKARRRAQEPQRRGEGELEQMLGQALDAKRRELHVLLIGGASDRRRAPLQAEILGLEAEVFALAASRHDAEADEIMGNGRDEVAARAEKRDQAAALRRRSERAHRLSVGYEAEARKAAELDIAERLAQLEQRLSEGSEIGQMIQHLT